MGRANNRARLTFRMFNESFRRPSLSLCKQVGDDGFQVSRFRHPPLAISDQAGRGYVIPCRCFDHRFPARWKASIPAHKNLPPRNRLSLCAETRSGEFCAATVED